MGSSAGTKVFLTYGWRATAAMTLGFSAWALFILMLRGPHCSRYTWFGWEGGWEARRIKVEEAEAKAAQQQQQQGNEKPGREGDVEDASATNSIQAIERELKDVQNEP